MTRTLVFALAAAASVLASQSATASGASGDMAGHLRVQAGQVGPETVAHHHRRAFHLQAGDQPGLDQRLQLDRLVGRSRWNRAEQAVEPAHHACNLVVGVEFVEEEDATVHVIVDASQSMDWGQPSKWAYAQRVAAALGYVALIGMDRLIGAAITDAYPSSSRKGIEGEVALFPPHRGRQQALTWFDWLSGLRLGGQTSPLTALTYYAANVRRAGPLIIIGDLMDDGWREGIQRLAGRHYEITLLHLLAPQEIDPELDGDLKLVDNETESAVEITADFDLLSRYRTRVQTWQSEWQQFCAARAINYAPIATSLPFEELVMSFLRTRGILR